MKNPYFLSFVIVSISILIINLGFCTCASSGGQTWNDGKKELQSVFGSVLRQEFLMDPNFHQLNHGSYGTYPKAVRDAQRSCEERAESNIDQWFRRDLYVLMVNARTELATLVNAAAEDIVIVPNTTGGMSAVLRSLPFVAPDSKILFFSTAYSSVKSLIQFTSDTNAGKVTGAQFDVHYPLSDDELVAAFETFVDSTPNIVLAVLDQISSVPAVKLPIERLVPICKSRGILTLIDGAHGIGQLPVDLTALAPDFYVSSLHKWLFVPRGSGMLYVDKKHQGIIHPAVIASSYGVPANFQDEFYWTGTAGYCNHLTIPAALEYRRKLGGEESIINYTHGLALEASKLMAKILDSTVLQSPDQIGNMFDVKYPLDNPDDPRITSVFWTNKYLDTTNIFVASHKYEGNWYTRVSTQVYTELKDFVHAALVIKDICKSINNGSAWQGSFTESPIPAFEIPFDQK